MTSRAWLIFLLRWWSRPNRSSTASPISASEHVVPSVPSCDAQPGGGVPNLKGRDLDNERGGGLAPPHLSRKSYTICAVTGKNPRPYSGYLGPTTEQRYSSSVETSVMRPAWASFRISVSEVSC